MKKLLLLIAFTFASFAIFAQVVPYKGTLEEALAEAKKVKKTVIFMASTEG